MDISQVAEIAVAGAGIEDVEIEDLEPVEVKTAVVGSLSQIISELVQNASAFSRPGQTVRIEGTLEEDEYVLSIADEGIGIPGTMLEALNRVLESPGGVGEAPNLGISLVARLAARSGVGVRLDEGEPGTRAIVTLPASALAGGPALEKPSAEVISKSSRRIEPLHTIDLTRYETGRPTSDHVFSGSETSADDAEAFLEKIFGPLRTRPRHSERPATRPDSNGGSVRPPVDRDREPKTVASTLQVRVPGENFDVSDDEPGVMSSEAAIDIRSALERYQAGRRDADEA